MISGKFLNKRTTKKKEKELLNKKSNTKMEMKPENVLDEVLTQAGIVHTQLLIHTHTPDIA